MDDSPWNSPGQNTGVGSHFLLQGIFPTQGSNPGLLHYRQILFFFFLQADSLAAESPGKPSKHSKDETKIEVGNPALTTSLTGLPEPNEAGMGEGKVFTSTNCHTNLKCS